MTVEVEVVVKAEEMGEGVDEEMEEVVDEMGEVVDKMGEEEEVIQVLLHTSAVMES